MLPCAQDPRYELTTLVQSDQQQSARSGLLVLLCAWGGARGEGFDEMEEGREVG